MPVPRDLRERAGVGTGDMVDVAISLDKSSRPLDLPDEGAYTEEVREWQRSSCSTTRKG